MESRARPRPMASRLHHRARSTQTVPAQNRGRRLDYSPQKPYQTFGELPPSPRGCPLFPVAAATAAEWGQLAPSDLLPFSEATFPLFQSASPPPPTPSAVKPTETRCRL